jgi:hypothetical protein
MSASAPPFAIPQTARAANRTTTLRPATARYGPSASHPIGEAKYVLALRQTPTAAITTDDEKAEYESKCTEMIPIRNDQINCQQSKRFAQGYKIPKMSSVTNTDRARAFQGYSCGALQRPFAPTVDPISSSPVGFSIKSDESRSTQSPLSGCCYLVANEHLKMAD